MKRCRTMFLSKPCARTLLGLLAACSVAVHAAAPEGDASGTDDAKINADATLRDPFWPVDYRPGGETEKESNATGEEKGYGSPPEGGNWNGAMGRITINGASSRAGGDFFAAVNGEVKAVGDTVSVQVDGTTYVWEVETIQPPGSVKLRRLGTRVNGRLSKTGR